MLAAGLIASSLIGGLGSFSERSSVNAAVASSTSQICAGTGREYDMPVEIRLLFRLAT